MNITVIRHSIRNRGGDRLVLDYMAQLIEQGHSVTYWTNEVNTCFSIHPKIRIQKIPLPGVLGTILFTLCRQFDSQVVLVDLVVMALFAHTRNQEKILLLAQDYDVTYHQSFLLRQFTNFAYTRVLNRRGIKTIAVSEGLAKILEQYHPRNLTAINNGVDLGTFRKNPKSRYFALKQQPHTILFFARNDYRKGLDIAIKTIHELQQSGLAPNWEIWTIGPEKIKNIDGVPVHNFGFITNEEELADILSAADIFMVPSRSEGLGLLLLQAMACECAIVTTTASSIITQEVNGLVSPIEDAHSLAMNIKRIIDEPKLADQLKEGSLKLAKNYDIREARRQFADFILHFHSPDAKIP